MNRDNPSSTEIGDLLDDARRRLVETGTRNRLVHVNRQAKRSNSLNIVNERSQDIFDLLRVQGKRMRFSAQGEDEKAQVEDQLPLLAQGSDTELDESRYRDLYLETLLGPEMLERRLLRLFMDARTSEEEQGFNILYLAMGFLEWFEEESSEVSREAPLILLPVKLMRNERRATFELAARDDDIVTNMPLQERLKSDFGIELPEIEDNEDWRPVPYFEEVSERISGRTRWSVDSDGIQLGFFSFAKLLMLRDLDPGNWPDGGLEENPMIRGLLAEGFECAPPLFAPEDNLDERLDPADIIQIVDADASQTKVIEEVRAERNFVVQGPPGTGKSQTIANIVAGAVHDGKTVLFVAEKMAALNVVHDRLGKLGLSGLCLELHSRSANKKAFLQELKRTLARGSAIPNVPDSAKALRAARDQLNRIANILHEPVPGYQFTPFSAIGEISRFFGRETSAPQIAAEGLARLDDRTRKEIAETIAVFADLLNTAGPRSAHPFCGVRAMDLQPTDLQRLAPKIDETLSVLLAHQAACNAIQQQTGLSKPQTTADAQKLAELLACIAQRPNAAEAAGTLLDHACKPRLAEALKAGRVWHAASKAAAAHFSDVAWDAAAADIRARLSPGVSSFWARLFGKYRSASVELSGLMTKPLPRGPVERLNLVDQLLDVQAKRRILAEDEAWLKVTLGEEWRGELTNFAELEDVVSWLNALRDADAVLSPSFLMTAAKISDDAARLSTTLKEQTRKVEQYLSHLFKRLDYALPGGAALADASLEDLYAKLSRMRDRLSSYGEWVRIQTIAEKIEGAGLSALVGALDSGALSAEDAVDEFLYATAEARWEAARAAVPVLNELRHLDRHDLVEKFRTLDKARMEETRRLLCTLHAERLPKGAYGEMGLVRGEMAKKRRHIAIRKLINGAGSVIQRIKPVFMMSPISVAQFLPPGSVTFDLLVIDEASQVRPEEALGAVGRCKQIVVVGDQMQLPPTSFFDRISTGEEAEKEDEQMSRIVRATEMESILTLCEARGLNNGLLEWHYRSRDPSLITVNNAEFYDHRLVLPPSPVQDDPDYGLAFTRVPGVYSSRSRGDGRPGTNRIEAVAVANRLAEYAREHPDLSIGVVAFSKAQSNMVTEVLEQMRREDPNLEALLRESKKEHVFVKNIENVQGDERDVILITVGYGPHEPNARLASMVFGPVNNDGGERRLNVLFSRARVCCEVLCSFDPADIDLARTTKPGPRVLKRFLEYAKSGQLHEPLPSGEVADSPFEEDVAGVIRGLGYVCDPQVGSAGFRIDIGVRHPDRLGQYLLAVECDGATYHSALWARERDRLRQDVLESMGWQFHRIWSTDWFYRRTDEIERLRARLEAAHGAERPRYLGSNLTDPVEQETRYGDEPQTEDISPPEAEQLDLSAPLYHKAEVQSEHPGKLPHEVLTAQLAKLVSQVAEAEGPIHVEEAARRVAFAFGLQRAGRRIREATREAAEIAHRKAMIVIEGPFLMTREQKRSPPVRDRSCEASPTTRAEYLSALEIRAAAELIECESGSVPHQELITAVCRLLGFARTGQDLRTRIANALPNVTQDPEG